MDDQTPANESNDQGLNKIDLTQLQNFSFGTQWTEAKVSSPQQRRDRDFDRGGEHRRDGGAPGDQKRDRRGFRKPLGAPGGPGSGTGAPQGPGGGQGGPGQQPGGRDQRPYGGPGQQDFNRGDRPPGGAGYQGGFRGGPRRDSQGGGERRDYQGGGERRDFRGGDGGGQFERSPYISPYLAITCYPEDVGFSAIVKAVRASCRTFQLFEITKAVLEKNDRFVLVIQRKPEDGDRSAPAQRDPAATAPAEGEPAKTAAPFRAPKPAPLFLSQPDHLPFETEEAAVQHVLKNHFAQFFDVADVEIDPPKGNFPVINKCSVTGELLGPPNYHLYQQIIQQHWAAKLSRMPFERFRDGIVSVREPEVAQAWLEKMKKTTRYTWKPAPPKTAPVAAVAAAAGTEAAAAPTQAPASETAPAAATDVPATPAPVDVAPAAPAPEAASVPAAPAVVATVEAPATPAGPSFDSVDEARAYLLEHARDRVVRTLDTIRFHGKLIEKLPAGEIKRAVEGHIERQRRFPLDTANALRGRLRREGFTIFKKGSRGVSYVCAVKRRFRVPGQVFSESITALIEFIEKHPLVHGKELPQKYLGIDMAAAIAAHAPVEGAPVSQAPFAALPADQAEKLRRMANDLRWLVTEGYVTEFSDGTYFAPPPVTPQAAKKAEEHGEEHDPEDFPVPPSAPPPSEAPPPEAAAPAPAEEHAVDASVAEPVASAPAETVSAAPVEPAAVETASAAPVEVAPTVTAPIEPGAGAPA